MPHLHHFREATVHDIDAMHAVRMSVKENVLNTPSLVTTADYTRYLTSHGKGWLCEIENRVVGLAIIDAEGKNIWGLFVHPAFEGKGIGKKLQELMLDWFFGQSRDTLWLGTAQNTRAEKFYEFSGWKKVGQRKNGEVKFEMSYEDWNRKNSGKL